MTQNINIKNDDKIDFVILWVDGNDPKWQKEKNKFKQIEGDASENRFRDCNNLQYLFRGIEQYANWVNNIYFITWGHVPSWLNTNNEKIKVIKHGDFIPAKYLPTFNSNVIELNLHRIKELSDKFVLFNDDLFILQKTKPTDFFINNIPTDVYVEYTQLASYYNDVHFFMKANILAIINKHFKKNYQTRIHRSKIINFKYKSLNFKTLHSMKFKTKYCGFWNFHNPQPYLKNTFKHIWEKEEQALDNSCYNKFRSSTDLGHYLMRYWQLVEGSFIPKKDESKYFTYQDQNLELIDTLIKKKYKTICINDANINIDFKKAILEVNNAFESIFPNKSEFEN